jgi:holin-like protein
MKYITQLLYILLFSTLGELLQAVLPLPIPAAIYGIVLLLIALLTGLLKEEKISDVAGFLIGIMPILFVTPAVKILQHWNLIASHLPQIIIIMVVSTFVVFTVSGLVTKWLSKKGGKEDG